MELTLTDQNFDEELEKAKLPVLVDFYADWCGPCKMMDPVIEALAEEYKDKLIIGKLNVDNNPGVSQKFGVMSIPTLILFKNQQPAKQLVGYQPKDALIKAIND